MQEATYSSTDIGGATFGGIHIGSLSVGGTPGLTSAAVNSQVTAPTLNVSSTSTNTPSVESVLVGGGAISASAAAPTAQTSLQTSASLGSSANVNVTTLTGPMASSTNTPSALDVHVNAGAIAGAALLPDAVAGGGTSAFVAEGATVTASSLNVQAQATNVATVTPIQISAGVLSGGYADPQASTSQDVEAYIGPAYGVSPNTGLTGTINVGSGTVTVNAQTLKNQATVNDFDIIAGAVGVGYVHPQATAGGEARAHIGGNFNITASAVNANGTSTNTATTDVISIDASAVSINLNVQGAITSETTEAYVGTTGRSHRIGGRTRLASNVDEYRHGWGRHNSGELRRHRVGQVAGRRGGFDECVRAGRGDDHVDRPEPVGQVDQHRRGQPDRRRHRRGAGGRRPPAGRDDAYHRGLCRPRGNRGPHGGRLGQDLRGERLRDGHGDLDQQRHGRSR